MPFERFASVAKSHTSCCCFNIVNIAAIVGTLQLIQVALFTSNAGAIYDQWRMDPPMPTTEQTDPNTSMAGRAYLQILLANTIAYQVAWLACLFLFALTFKYWKSVLVIPNLVMQVFSMLLGLMLIGALSQAINETNNNNSNSYMPITYAKRTRQVFFTAALVFVVIMWLVEFAILVVLAKFYVYLKHQDHNTIATPFGHSAPTNGTRRGIEQIATSEMA